jgi:ribosomal-protein-alanine N-acetyltransferase
VAEGNAAARALYARAGYRECGRRKGYYQRPDGSRDDAVVMEKPL